MIQLQNNKIMLQIICKKYEESLFPLNQGNFPKTLLSQKNEKLFYLKKHFFKKPFLHKHSKKYFVRKRFFSKKQEYFSDFTFSQK